MFVLAAFFSILIHELGHAWCMRAFGGRAAIMLHGLGGFAVSDRRFKRAQEIAVSLAGPVVQILFGLSFVAFLMARFDYSSITELQRGLPYKELGVFDNWLIDVIQVSLIWGIFNLIPIFPMDGGQVLFHLLGPKGQKITFSVSVIAGAILVYLFFKSGMLFGAIFLGVMTYENIKRFRGEPTSSVLFPR